MKRHEMVLSLKCTERVLLHLCVEGDLELMANKQDLV